MRNLIIIPVQSFSDIITNSSSELFVTNTDMTIKQVIDTLKEITTGYQDPIRFSLEEYRKAKSDLEESDYFGYGTYYGSAEDDFIDLEDEDDITRYRIKYLGYYPFEIPNPGLLLDLYCKELTDIGYSDDKGVRHIDSYDVIRNCEAFDKAKKFFKEYEESGKPLPEWWMPSEEDTLQYLDGKILILSEDDNSIPYDTFDLINDVFNGFNIHLG